MRKPIIISLAAIALFTPLSSSIAQNIPSYWRGQTLMDLRDKLIHAGIPLESAAQLVGRFPILVASNTQRDSGTIAGIQYRASVGPASDGCRLLDVVFRPVSGSGQVHLQDATVCPTSSGLALTSWSIPGQLTLNANAPLTQVAAAPPRPAEPFQPPAQAQPKPPKAPKPAAVHADRHQAPVQTPQNSGLAPGLSLPPVPIPMTPVQVAAAQAAPTVAVLRPYEPTPSDAVIAEPAKPVQVAAVTAPPPAPIVAPAAAIVAPIQAPVVQAQAQAQPVPVQAPVVQAQPAPVVQPAAWAPEDRANFVKVAVEHAIPTEVVDAVADSYMSFVSTSHPNNYKEEKIYTNTKYGDLKQALYLASHNGQTQNTTIQILTRDANIYKGYYCELSFVNDITAWHIKSMKCNPQTLHSDAELIEISNAKERARQAEIKAANDKRIAEQKAAEQARREAQERAEAEQRQRAAAEFAAKLTGKPAAVPTPPAPVQAATTPTTETPSTQAQPVQEPAKPKPAFKWDLDQ